MLHRLAHRSALGVETVSFGVTITLPSCPLLSGQRRPEVKDMYFVLAFPNRRAFPNAGFTVETTACEENFQECGRRFEG
jgi:hypothetical protein